MHAKPGLALSNFHLAVDDRLRLDGKHVTFSSTGLRGVFVSAPIGLKSFFFLRLLVLKRLGNFVSFLVVPGGTLGIEVWKFSFSR